MKRITSLAVILCLLGAALSCTHDEPSKSERNDGNNVHEWEDSTLSGDAVMSFSINNMTVTRAGTRSTVNYAGDGNYSFVTGDKIAIQVSRTVSEAEDIEGVKLFEIQSDGTLSCLDTYPFTWRSQGDRVNIRAWHYVGAETTTTSPDGAVFSLETTQDNGYKELLYCNAPNQDYTTSNITLNFAHQLSRIVFNVKHDRSGTLTVTAPIVGNSTAFPVKARFTAPTGTNTIGEWTPTAYSTLTPKTETTQTGFQKTYSAVIFPNTYAQNTVIFTINNAAGNYVYKVNETVGLPIVAGTQYNYTITVKDDHSKTTTAAATRSNLTVGDILCSDGSIYTSANAKYITGEYRTAIGVIAYVSTGANDPTCENKLALVMALKNAGSYQWGNQGVEENDTYFPNYYYSNIDQVFNETVTGKAKLDYILTDGHTTHKAFEACRNFSVSTSGVTGSTGWFLPTARQWYWTLLRLGGLSSYTRNLKQEDTATRNNINTAMSCVGTGKYDALINDVYWTSTEWTKDYTWFMRFTDSWLQIGATDYLDNKDLQHLVRPFLAF